MKKPSTRIVVEAYDGELDKRLLGVLLQWIRDVEQENPEITIAVLV